MRFIHPVARSSVPSGERAIVIEYYLPKEIEVAVRHGQPEDTIHAVGDKVFEDTLNKLVAI